MNRPMRQQKTSLPTYTPFVWHLVCAFVVMLPPKASIAAEDDLVISLTPPVQADRFFQMTDEQWDANLERWVFQNFVFGGNGAVGVRVVVNGRIANQTRASLDTLMEQRIREVTEKYDLNQDKLNRLRLAAEADKARFEREFDVLRQRFRTLPKTQANIGLISAEAMALGQKNRSFLGSGSFFAKASNVILAGESPHGRMQPQTQSRPVGLRTAVREPPALGHAPPISLPEDIERSRIRHRGNVESVVREFNWRIAMNKVQRQKLVDLLLQETHVPKSRGDVDDVAVKYRITQIAEDKLKPLFEENQWPRVLQVIDGYREFKPVLIRYGLVDADGRFPDQPADAATPVNRGSH